MKLSHKLTHTHKHLVIGITVILFCKRRFSPVYTVKIHRGPGFLWEEVPPPKKTEDLDSWWESLNIDMPE